MEESDPGNALSLAFELMEIKRADAVSKAPKCAWYAVELDEMDRILQQEGRKSMVLGVKDLAVDGNDVLEVMGGKPGPAIGRVLHQLLAAVVDGEVENTYGALREELWRSFLENE
jgi:tRNA nucleotidyltransferase (CCA-adding enzyme)